MEYDRMMSSSRAAMGLAEAGFKTACVTKLFPTRSHTVGRLPIRMLFYLSSHLVYVSGPRRNQRCPR